MARESILKPVLVGGPLALVLCVTFISQFSAADESTVEATNTPQACSSVGIRALQVTSNAINQAKNCLADYEDNYNRMQNDENISVDESLGCASVLASLKTATTRMRNQGLLNPRLLREFDRIETRARELGLGERRTQVLRSHAIARLQNPALGHGSSPVDIRNATRPIPEGGGVRPTRGDSLPTGAVIRGGTRTGVALRGARVIDSLISLRGSALAGGATAFLDYILPSAEVGAGECDSAGGLIAVTQTEGGCQVNYTLTAEMARLVNNPEEAAARFAENPQLCTYYQNVVLQSLGEVLSAVPFAADHISIGEGGLICAGENNENYTYPVNIRGEDGTIRTYRLSNVNGVLRVRSEDDPAMREFVIQHGGNTSSVITNIEATLAGEGGNLNFTPNSALADGNETQIQIYEDAQSFLNMDLGFFGNSARACCDARNSASSQCANIGLARRTGDDPADGAETPTNLEL